MESHTRTLMMLGFMLGLSIPQTARACSSFVLRSGEDFVLGRNFDFWTGKGMLCINHRGVEKTSLVPRQETPLKWISTYGSLTFNQIGKEFPFGGMNEVGLVIVSLGLEETDYPDVDDRFGLNESQWIQYQLDVHGTVHEVIESDQRVRIIADNPAKIHFLVCDKKGDAATVEFLDGAMMAHMGDALPVEALTNSVYSECTEYLKEFQGFGGSQEIPTSQLSEDRFLRVAQGVRDSDPGTPLVDRSFEILNFVAATEGPQYSFWQIVYNPRDQRIDFRTHGNRKIRSVCLADLNFACENGPKVLDLDADVEGDVSASFIDYSQESNVELVRSVFKIYDDVGFMSLPGPVVDMLANYPGSTRCSK